MVSGPYPDDIVAPLLRALVTIRPAPEARLYLVRTEHGRPPDWDAINDYNVLFRGRSVGRNLARDLPGFGRLPVALGYPLAG